MRELYIRIIPQTNMYVFAKIKPNFIFICRVYIKGDFFLLSGVAVLKKLMQFEGLREIAFPTVFDSF